MLDLRIPIPPASIKSLKAYLVGALPRVKASHRIEGARRICNQDHHCVLWSVIARVSTAQTRYSFYLRRNFVITQPLYMQSLRSPSPP